MSLQKNGKLKLLYRALPEKVAVPSSWLREQGYSTQLISKYVKQGILQKLGRGLYARSEVEPDWKGVMVGVQRFAGLEVYMGGLSALNLQGFAHYLPLSRKQRIALYSRKNPPAWLRNIASTFQFEFYKKPWFGDLGLKAYPSGIRDYDIEISSPERAILELLYLVEKEGVTFTFVAEIFENLTSLRPGLLNKLLQSCESIKVKRLFLYFSDRYNHPWSKYIDKDTVEIGTGKMQIVKNGKLDKTYLITVPKGQNDDG